MTRLVNPQRHIWWKESGSRFQHYEFYDDEDPGTSSSKNHHDHDTTMTKIGKHAKREH